MVKLPVRPLHDRVVVFPDEPEKKTEGGIIIPDTAQEKPRTGVVVASGPGLKDLSNETKPGDRIFFGKYAGSELEYDGKQYIIMRESDVLLIDDGKKKK